MLPHSLTVVHLKRSYQLIFFCDNFVPGSHVRSGQGFRGVTNDLLLRTYCLADFQTLRPRTRLMANRLINSL